MAKEKKGNNLRILKRLLLDAKSIYGWLAFTAVIALTSVVLNLIAPIKLGEISDIIYNYWHDGTAMNGLAIKSLILALIYVGVGITALATMLIMNNVVSRFFTCTIRINISDKIRRLPVKFVDDTPHGEVISRMTEDVSVMGNTLHNVFNILINGFLQLIGIIVMMYMINAVMATIVIAVVPASLAIAAIVASKSEKHFNDNRKEWGNLYAFLEQDYSGFESIKVFNLEKWQINEHAKITEKLKTSGQKGHFLASIVQPVVAFFNNIAYLIIAVIGGYLVINGKVSLGGVMAIILYAKLFSSPLENIASGMGMIQRVFASAKRVYELMDKEEMPMQQDTLCPSGDGEVEFIDASFSYDPKQPLITNMNLKLSAGQRVAIVGPTGGGKTTIINLLMRFYELDSGKITIDGMDIKDIEQKQLRKLFGMVLQDTWLFSGTIKENIAYGKDNASEQDIIDAARHAFIDKFIETLPDKYDTIINEESTNISSGQKQLLTIARCYLANPKILILDEATSNVDTRTELLIQETMNKLMAGRTSFVIAHRLSTIVDADLIVVINDGCIVEQGTHTQLLQKGGCYSELYNSQYAHNFSS